MQLNDQQRNTARVTEVQLPAIAARAPTRSKRSKKELSAVAEPRGGKRLTRQDDLMKRKNLPQNLLSQTWGDLDSDELSASATVRDSMTAMTASCTSRWPALNHELRWLLKATKSWRSNQARRSMMPSGSEWAKRSRAQFLSERARRGATTVSAHFPCRDHGWVVGPRFKSSRHPVVLPAPRMHGSTQRD